VSLLDAAAGNDRLTQLRALRHRIALELDDTASARDVASLSQRFMDVLEQIADSERLTPAKAGTGLDEFTQRRAAKARSHDDLPW
jgi:hypothetical protein